MFFPEFHTPRFKWTAKILHLKKKKALKFNS